MRSAHIALAVVVAAIWGFNFVAIKIGLRDFPPLLFSGLRFLVAALPLMVTGWQHGPGVPWRHVLGIGLVLGVVKFSLLFIGIDIGMPAGLASLVLQAQACFTVLYAALVLGETPAVRQLLGMAVAFGGIGLIAAGMPAGDSSTGLLLVVGAAAAWGGANILIKLARPTDMFRLMIWVSAVPPLPLFALSYVLEGPDRIADALTHLSWPGMAALLYVGILSTLLAFAVWSFLLKTYTASLVAPFSLLVPVFGMSAAALLLDEDFSMTKLGGGALVLTGLGLAAYRGARVRAALASDMPPATQPVRPESS